MNAKDKLKQQPKGKAQKMPKKKGMLREMLDKKGKGK